MSNRLFQGVIHQMKEAIDRVIGVIDENGVIVACSELVRVGEVKQGVRDELSYSSEFFVSDGYTYRPIQVGIKGEYTVFVEGEDKSAEKISKILTISLGNIKNLYDEKYDKGSFIKNIILDNILPSDIYIKSKELHFNTEEVRIVFLIKFYGKTDMMPFEMLQNMFPDKSKDYVISVGEHDIVLVKDIKPGTDIREIERIATNIADTLMWGHDNPQRAWTGDVYGFRFYNRCLTPEEIADNASADEKNYRNGNYFEPEVEYDPSNDAAQEGVDLSKYKNDVIVLDEFTDLVPALGEYGCLNVHNLHFYGEHQGIKIMPTTNDDGTITGNPEVYVNYGKYVRRIGAENLNADNIKYVAVKIKVQGTVEDMQIWGLAGENHSNLGVDTLVADNWPECNGESEYMLFDMEEAWTGLINKFCFKFVNPSADAVIYIEEIALFADQASAYAYAGQEVPTEAPTEEVTEPTEETTEEAPTAEDTTAPTTEAPTEEPKSGCGSVVGFGVIAILGAAFVALKKDRE